MLAYQEGDNSAFDQLYARHKGPLYRYFLRQSVNQSVAEELYQEVWLSIIKSRASYRATAKFTTYLYHLAHNKLIDHYRKNKKVYNTGDTGDEVELLTGSEADGPEYRMAEGELLACLLQTLEQLPVEQKEAFLLKEEGGLSVEEIARVCAIKTETAKSRVRYAMQCIKQALAANGGEN